MSTKSDRCATVGHGSTPATHEVTWSSPGDRANPVTERVCAPCADSYTRRPSLKATAREIASPQRGRSR
jgi:hypothetical protein